MGVIGFSVRSLSVFAFTGSSSPFNMFLRAFSLFLEFLVVILLAKKKALDLHVLADAVNLLVDLRAMMVATLTAARHLNTIKKRSKNDQKRPWPGRKPSQGATSQCRPPSAGRGATSARGA